MSEVVDLVGREGQVMDRITILDHGYIELVEYWGSDESIICAARMSTAKGFLGWGSITCPSCEGAGTKDGKVVDYAPEERGVSIEIENGCPKCKGLGQVDGDEKLLQYLYENNHCTPFEFGGLVLEVQAPIFVFREWHRHRTQSYNEMSARYTPLPDLNYVPTVDRLMRNAGRTNKQAGTVHGSEELTRNGALAFQRLLETEYRHQQDLYDWALRSGVPKELARIGLPVGRYSRMRVHACLRNWLSFLTLRMAPNAQWEIQEFARAVGVFVERAFPRTWKLFIEG